MKDPICIFLRGRTLQIHEYFRRSDPYPPLKKLHLSPSFHQPSHERSYMYFLEGENASNPWVFQEIWPLPPPKKITPLAFFPPTVSWKILYVYIFLRGRMLQIHEYFRRSDPYPPLKKLHLSPSFHQPSHERSYMYIFSWGGERFKSMSISGDLTPTPPKKITPLAFFPPTVSWKILYVFSWGGECFKSMSISGDLTPTPQKKLHLSPSFHQPSHERSHMYFVEGGDSSNWFGFPTILMGNPLKTLQGSA